jgi:hypothetical protein
MPTPSVTPDKKRYDTPEQFAAEYGRKPKPEIWTPVNVAPIRIQELKTELAGRPPAEVEARERAFFEANKASDAPVAAIPVAAAAGSAGEVQSAVKDAVKDAKKWMLQSIAEGLLEMKKEWPLLAWIGIAFLKPFAHKFWLFDVLTPDQLKELGFIKPTTTWPDQGGWAASKPWEETRERARTVVDTLVVSSTAGYFLRKSRPRDYDGLWSALYAWVKDAWNSDETKARKAIEARAGNILGWEALEKVSYKSLVSEKDNPKLAEKLGLKNMNSKEDIPALRLAVHALAKNEELIQSLIGKQYPNWRDMWFHEFLSHFYQYTGMATLTKISTNIQNIDLTKPGEFAASIRKMAISRNEQGGVSGYIGERISAYKDKWIGDEVVVRLLIPWTDGNQKMSDYRTTLVNSPYKDAKSNAFLSEITKEDGFGKWLIGMMNEVWLGSYTSSLGNGNGIDMEELLMAYIITGGQKNIADLSQSQQNEIIPLLYSIAARTNPGAFAVDKATDFLSWSAENPYVKRMAEFIGEATSDAAYIAMFKWLGFTLEAGQAILALRDDPKKAKYFWAIMATLWIGIGSILILRKPVLSIVLTAWLITGIAKLAGITAVSR